ncbi:hypothetical protein CDQ92_07625 [Sphingopyxis bauzanensis]|uniref:DUF421 domain-containing protein n=1 Tax=Sphingopyxis bauzanensis TaxID=651663 RepID=A0A246JV58_9SPHN|nr:YetF domain-containing protein [Sphingopyxis bauzanensis]OWQ96961.1 hypothetical protein CDQ92_07625 [Sphingopyxis bauzanensis]GGJ42520.1 DUF421 domain-containing protein [Sphingopyxis bauzanensis]
MVDNWDALWRILLLGAAAYLALIALLRVSGKRTLAKLNAFDLVVTVALGSTLATIVLSRDVTLLEGLAALLMLIALQYVIAAMAVRWRVAERLAKSDPRPVLIDGVFDCEALRRERVTRADVLSAIRSKGFGDLCDIAAVVLETDGSLSVISHEHAGSRSALPLVRDSS